MICRSRAKTRITVEKPRAFGKQEARLLSAHGSYLGLSYSILNAHRQMRIGLLRWKISDRDEDGIYANVMLLPDVSSMLSYLFSFLATRGSQLW